MQQSYIIRLLFRLPPDSVQNLKPTAVSSSEIALRTNKNEAENQL